MIDDSRAPLLIDMLETVEPDTDEQFADTLGMFTMGGDIEVKEQPK
jgi:hypothetical protein